MLKQPPKNAGISHQASKQASPLTAFLFILSAPAAAQPPKGKHPRFRKINICIAHLSSLAVLREEKVRNKKKKKKSRIDDSKVLWMNENGVVTYELQPLDNSRTATNVFYRFPCSLEVKDSSRFIDNDAFRGQEYDPDLVVCCEISFGFQSGLNLYNFSNEKTSVFQRLNSHFLWADSLLVY